MPRFKLANVQNSAVCERPETEWISDFKEASGDAIEELAGSIVSEILERAVKRVINKRKRVKRKLNIKLFSYNPVLIHIQQTCCKTIQRFKQQQATRKKMSSLMNGSKKPSEEPS